MELSQDNNIVANEWSSAATPLPFTDQLAKAALMGGEISIKEGLKVTGLTRTQPKETQRSENLESQWCKPKCKSKGLRIRSTDIQEQKKIALPV